MTFHCERASLGISVDARLMQIDDAVAATLLPRLEAAMDEMAALESGSIANPDENRMVGHYWLRATESAPSDSIRSAIEQAVDDVKMFAADVRSGAVRPETRERFEHAVIIGIGGSALGPQFVTDALAHASAMPIHFLDNTDPDGIDRVFDLIGDKLASTLCIVVSKSGGTRETHNGMMEARHRYETAGLSFAQHAVAITCAGSGLDQRASSEGWLHRFPLWDWVGGRTSVTSAVGLLPAALQGIDMDAFLGGAAACDEWTRERRIECNPAAILATAWFAAGGGHGSRSMVVLPYKDRLALFGRYLQQLVMESIGKRQNRSGQAIHQGLTVYGNKGSTDQHAFVQQLRDGPDDFFTVLIGVLQDRDGASIEIESGVTSGDYLHGFLLGTRKALSDAGRRSLTISMEEVSARSLGALIAMFERAVGFYASLVDVNAYDQPGVEAGKRAADAVIALQGELVTAMQSQEGTQLTADEWAAQLGREDEAADVGHILRHLSANPGRGVLRTVNKAGGMLFGVVVA